ncbi:MAG: FecR domain-containing protein [Chitinophagaceae bacterium]
MEKAYTKYKLDDFLLDEDFQNWFRNRNHQTSEGWQQFLLEEPLHPESFREAVQVAELIAADGFPENPDTKARLWNNIVEMRSMNSAPVVPLWRRFRVPAIAAAVVLVLAGAAWIGGFFEKKEAVQVAQKTVNDAQPGSDKATLTLEDGKVIELDVASAGNLATNGNIRVVKKGGELTYEVNDAGAMAGEMAYHKLATPRGGQFRIMLPDGSRVWLNASSSLRFPSSFAANERRVEVTGEAYFEVAKDKQRPFRVMVSGSEVEVLGTSFNIMAYSNEPSVKTTLLEGSVKMTRGTEEALLVPGQQLVEQEGKMTLKKNVDTGAEVAWKNGMFLFNGAALPQVMRQLERWYDVEVQYENGVPKGTLTGEFPRSMMLSEVLQILELSGVVYKIENKKLIISSK